MTTTADRLRAYWSERQVDREQLAALFARYWEVALMATIVGVALVLRLWGLTARAIHHDEAIHWWYAYNWAGEGSQLFGDGVTALFDWGTYTHDPTYHGPFPIFLTVLIFKIFGDYDFTARLPLALAGTALVALPFFLRDYLGRAGAFIAAALIAFSPILLYTSRFAHYDMLMALFTLGMAVLILRYLREPRTPYLYGLAAVLTASFLTKEVAYLTTAIFIAYLEFRLAQDLYEQLSADRSFSPLQTALIYLLLLPTAWLMAALWPLLERPRKWASLHTLPASGHLMIVLGTLTLPQFAAAIQELPFVGPGTFMGEPTLMRITVFFAIAGTAAVGLLWNSRVWAISAAIFYLPYFLLYTTFFTNGGDIWNPVNGDFWTSSGTEAGGFWTGVWGGLDYWLDQQIVRRGNQPDYYFFMFLPVYEFLPLLIALGGTLWYAFRGRLEHSLLSASAIVLIFAFSLMADPDQFGILARMHMHLAFITAIGAVLLLPMDRMLKFLLYWFLASLYAFTIAGEKMPWLSTYLALPLALVAARILDGVVEGLIAQVRAFNAARRPSQAEAPPSKRRRRAQAPTATAPTQGQVLHPLLFVSGAAACALLAAAIFQAAGPASGPSVLAWLFSAAAALAVLAAAYSVSWPLAGQAAVIALVAALGIFTIRAAGVAAYDEGDAYTRDGPGGVPPELLIYAQGAPDLDLIMAEIESFAQQTGQGKNLQVVYDNSSNIWPWPWYLRDYNAFPIDSVENYVPVPNSVALIDLTNRSAIEQNYQDKVAFSQEYRHMWWFHDTYSGLEPIDFLRKALAGGYLSTWRSYFIDRFVPNQTETPDRIAFFFGGDEIKPVPVQTPQVAGTVSPQVQRVIGTPGKAEGQLSQPADIATDAEGNLYVVDTLNQRVQKFAPDGTVVATVGEPGSGDGQFRNPHGPDYEPNEGPWGIAVDDAGNVYVADTWNNRIQKFTADLEFVAAWGEQDGLFGPRDIAIDADGNLLVADTGNKRIVKYSPAGELITTFGTDGAAAGQFNEPSSISVAPNGDIYVADYWNRRVQHFDPQFNYVGEFRIGTWGSQGITDRAYLVALEDGTIVATDPANGQVIVYGPDGRWLGAWRLVPEDEVSRPVGITIGPDLAVYVTDGAASKIRVVPLNEILVEPATVVTGTPTPTATPALGTSVTP